MSNVKVSALTALPAASATHTYGVVGSASEGKVPVNTATGLVVYDGVDLTPYADNAAALGGDALRWTGITLADNGSGGSGVVFSDGVNPDGAMGFSIGVGPTFQSVATKVLTLDVSGLTTPREIVVPNAGGTMTVLGNASTGSGSVVLATAPTMTNPVVGTQSTSDNSTKAASTAYVNGFFGDPQFFTPAAADTVSPAATGPVINCFIDPSGTIASMTLTLPTGAVKGQVCYVNFHQIVTALTVTGTNVDNKGLTTPTAATATSTFAWAWDSVSAKWNRFL
jgi:hypothetical protein